MTIFFSIPEYPVPGLRNYAAGGAHLAADEPYGTRVPYRTALRVIGNALDAQHACSVNILEGEAGFTVRFQQSPVDVTPTVQEMTHTQLEAMAERMALSRRNIWTLFKTKPEALLRYESILRTLGRELDIVDASGLLVDEVDDGLVVTYHYKKPSEGYAYRKRLAFLGHDALQDAAGKDQDRRSTR